MTAGTDHRMAGHVDIAPTLLAAAGTSGKTDARSLLGSARTGPILTEYWLDPKNSKVSTWAALWDGEAHYLENYGKDGKTTFRELRNKLSAARHCTGTGCP